MLRGTVHEEDGEFAEAAQGEETLDALVRRVDPDRWAATRFAEPLARARLIALYAVNYEVSRIAESVTDPALGRVRLQWWLETIAARDAAEHPAAVALSEALRECSLDVAPLIAACEARNADLDDAPFASWGDLEQYVDATAGGVFRLAAGLCSPAHAQTPHTVSLARAAGRAWGLVGLLRALPHWRARRRTFFPRILFERVGFSPENLYAGDRVHQTTAAIRVVLERARAAHADANRLSLAAPKELFGSYGYVALLRDYMRGLEADPPTSTLSAWRRHARLVGAALTGAV